MRLPERRRTRLLLLALGLLVFIPGVGAASCKLVLNCGTGGDKDVPALAFDRPGLTDTVVVSGFQAPSSFAFLPGGRVLVGQVDGTIHMVKNGQILPEPFLDLRRRVNTERQRGLVGLEVHPDFESNGQVFLMYTVEDGSGPVDGDKAVRVTRVTAEGDRAAPGSEVVVLGGASRGSCEGMPVTADCITGNGIHTGGGLAFGDDGTLFVGTGDGQVGNPGEYEADARRAQDLDSLSGKVLRVTPEGRGLPSNPFWTGNADDNRSKVWSYGLRNPFRVTVRPDTQVPYVGDVGWDLVEEVDVAARGVNLGWPCFEGRKRALHYRDTPLCAALYARGGVRFPLVDLAHDLASSVTGGEFQDRSTYVYGDYGAHWLRSLRVDGEDRLVTGSDERLAVGTLSPTQIRVDATGDLYYLSITGTLHRVRSVSR